jgi:hypothetical protein
MKDYLNMRKSTLDKKKLMAQKDFIIYDANVSD